MSITKRFFDQTPSGESVSEYTLANARGASVSILDFGGVVTKIIVPDRDGRLEDVNLGFDDLRVYASGSCYLGALVGRYANRIGGARFQLDGKSYPLDANDGENSLHGGYKGYQLRLWQAQTSEPDGVPTLTLRLTSPDGDQGFPGTLSIRVDYSFNNAGELRIHYRATTDKPTLVNLTNHSYFNLDGHASGTVENHELQIFADEITEAGPGLIPTGRVLSSADTPYGFTAPTRIGDVLAQRDACPALKAAGGVDFNYRAGRERESKLIATLYSPRTGRVMEVETDQPGVQCYTSQGLDVVGKDGAKYGSFSAVCLETQHDPDAIHHPHFPSVVLRPQDTYDTFTVYRFGVR